MKVQIHVPTREFEILMETHFNYLWVGVVVYKHAI